MTRRPSLLFNNIIADLICSLNSIFMMDPLDSHGVQKYIYITLNLENTMSQYLLNSPSLEQIHFSLVVFGG